MNKLNVFLALREKGEGVFKNAIGDLIKKFKSDQGLFTGERKTYSTRPGYADDPSKRAFRKVASDVDQQLSWFLTTNSDYFDILFGIEKTNSAGPAAELVVDGKSWGEYSSLELLRLKALIENPKLFPELFNGIPVRSDSLIWEASPEEMYLGMNVFQTPLEAGVVRTTEKTDIILHDPHPDKARAPQVSAKSTIVEIGDYTAQNFSGQWTMRQRAELIAKLSRLHIAVTKALEEANSTEVQPSDLGKKFLEHLFSK